MAGFDLQRVRRFLRMTAGVLLILLGLIGIVVPIMPGVVLIAAGLVMVAPRSRLACRVVGVVARARARFARLRGGAVRERGVVDVSAGGG
jgi:sulfite exporter TauE/SafE